MQKVFVIVTAVIIIFLAIHMYLTGDLMPYSLLFLGVIMWFLGLILLNEKRKVMVLLLFVTSGVFFFSFILSVYNQIS